MSKIVSCPQCGKDSVYGEENPSRPFCSQRCKMIDLGTWADEGYRVPDSNQDPFSEIPSGENLPEPDEQGSKHLN